VASESGARDDGFPPASRGWYAVVILLIAYVSSFIDRQIIFLLVAPIRRDLGISDTQMSLLMGLAFAIFYTFLGLPIARLADSRNRRDIIAWGIALWSVMTALCGLARSYTHLVLARFGVGVGEAALGPPSYSLIADYFPAPRLATAISVYSMGIYVGAGLANLIGGAVIGFVSGADVVVWPLIGEVRAWQTVFLVIGIPGILIALLMRTVVEPARRGSAVRVVQRPISDVVRYVRENAATFVGHNFGFGLYSLVNFGTAAWLPTFLIRTHGWTAARAGLVLGTLTVIFGSLGILCGGRLADWLVRRGRLDGRVAVGILSAAGQLLCGIVYLSASDARVAVIALIPYNFFAAFPWGAAPAAIQEIVPNEMRAQVSAVYLFVINLVGLGLGPTVVAWVTDSVFQSDAAVGRSLLVVTTAGLAIAIALLASALRPYRESLRYRERWTG
jgi:MFS family permease